MTNPTWKKIPYISSKLLAMKRSTSFILFVMFVLFRYAAAQTPLQPPQNVAASVIPNYSVLDIDELLVIEDAAPELPLEGRKPLLLVHGWNFDGQPAPPGGNYWNNFVNYLKNDATLKANFKPYLVKYWSNYVTVKEIGVAFRDQVEAMGLHEQKVAIIGHSMGALFHL